MTNNSIIQIAMNQSAEDIGCYREDFLTNTNKIVPIKLGINAKKYYSNPIGCSCISYGNNIVAASNEALYNVISEYINKIEFYHCFESPYIQWLSSHVEPFGQTIWLMVQYFLPDINKISKISCKYTVRFLNQSDFKGMYTGKWSNALCDDRKHLNVLGVGAYDGNDIIGLAACTADAENMWQIGVDVLPQYRGQGIASSLTSILSLEVIERGKVPFYCSSWSNIRSIRNAIKCGFVPSWVEMIIKPITVVNKMDLL